MLGKTYPILEAPGWSNWMPKRIPGWGGGEGGSSRQVVKSCLSTSTVMKKSDGVDSQVLFFLG
jgi:hypothetical protein